MDASIRTEYLLALILLNGMKNATQREKVHQLNLAGFSNSEIADLLQTTSAVIAQALYEGRRKSSRSSKTSRK